MLGYLAAGNVFEDLKERKAVFLQFAGITVGGDRRSADWSAYLVVRTPLQADGQ